MTPNLTTDQIQALHDNADRPTKLVDPGTNRVYFLVSAEVFDQIKPLIGEEDFDIRETYAAQFAAMNTPECWDAPGMKLYDEYDAHKPKS
jgi:hypothetical protein